MASVVAYIGQALICFAGQCHPMLVGPDTPVGVHQLVERRTATPGYGGVVLQFKETETEVYAIHRLWLRDRRIDRAAAIRSNDPKVRAGVTRGCINVEDEVFEALLKGPYLTLEVRP